MSQLYSATPVFNVWVPVLFKRLFIQYRAFVMDSISFSVASRIKEVFLFLFLARQCCAWTWKITTCSDRFHARASRSHVINSRFTLTPIRNTYNRRSCVWFFTFALHVHVSSSRIDGIPASIHNPLSQSNKQTNNR